MAEPVVSFVLNQIGKLASDEAKYLHGTSEQAKLLQTELKRMLRFLRDADSRRDESETIQGWVSEARDIAYRAEDAIESYAFLKTEVVSLTGLLCIFKEAYSLHMARSEIESVIEEISRFTTDLGNYGIHPTTNEMGNTIQDQLRRTYSTCSAEEEIFVGLEKDLMMLVDHVVDEEHRFVSIVGMGGLGKTTMARKVYQHHRVRSHFSMQAWVCISQQWQTEDILKAILEKFGRNRGQFQDVSSSSVQQLVREVMEFQRDNKCLIVLDDIWSSETWDCIKEAFPKHTKILLTTRNMEVAEHLHGASVNNFIHQLRLLTKEESWELFQKIAMITTLQPQEHIEEATKMGKEIVDHCGGLPLAVITLGGILSTKRTLDEWKVIDSNMEMYLGRERGSEPKSKHLEYILGLSCTDLPYYLKPCFLYLAMFPEDREIQTSILYQRWMAEGFVLSNHIRRGETLMDVADRYLGELGQRCMVQVKIERVEHRVRRFGLCLLHDVIRELCLGISRRDNFCQAINFGGGSQEAHEETSMENINNNILRLQVYVQRNQADIGMIIRLAQGRMSRHLRSFSISRGVVKVAYQIKGIENFKMLRVLVLSNIYHRAYGSYRENAILSDAISKLVHLRYLDLDRSNIQILTSSISNLKHLQTFILPSKTKIIFDVLWKMGEMRYLYLPRYTSLIASETVKPWINICIHHNVDPMDIDAIAHKKSLQLDGLSKLEVLDNLDLNLCKIEDLKKLVNLRVLRARVREKIDELVCEVMQVMPNLRYISLRIEEVDFSSPREEGCAVFKRILSSSNLCKLEMVDYCKIEKWPRYHEVDNVHLSGIQYLHLSRVSYTTSDDEDVDPMKTLEKLPNLRALRMVDSYNGKEMSFHSMGFPNLTELFIEYLCELERLKVEEGAMPKLLSLVIIGCCKLEMIPDGLKSITSLQKLRLNNMPQSFIDRSRVVDGREGPDFHKIRHVPYIHIGGVHE